MPVPINPNGPKKGMEKLANYTSLLDVSFLAQSLAGIDKNAYVLRGDNKNATLVMQLWTQAKKKDDGRFKLITSSKFSSYEISQLRSLGMIVGNSESFEFTEKGRKVIKVMALGEENKLRKEKAKKSYTEILASMDKRGKKGYRIAFSFPNNIRLAE